MLKIIGVTLERISDPDKYMFFEQAMRCGVSYILIKDKVKHLKINIFSTLA